MLMPLRNPNKCIVVSNNISVTSPVRTRVRCLFLEVLVDVLAEFLTNLILGEIVIC